ncbi:MAG: hypothetical protein AAGF48_14010 [Pseudomonadota bacterium]
MSERTDAVRIVADVFGAASLRLGKGPAQNAADPSILPPEVILDRLLAAAWLIDTNDPEPWREQLRKAGLLPPRSENP